MTNELEKKITEQMLLDQLLELLTLQQDLIKSVKRLTEDNREYKVCLSMLESFVAHKGLTQEFAMFVHEQIHGRSVCVH